jgi:predicted transposase YbfD/YdcC
LVTLDGKTLRGTIPRGQSQGVHLLAAYLPDEGVVLMQVAVGHKENELVAAPSVLAAVELSGRVVCADALFTQRALSVQILAQGGHYIWFVKDNQPRLRQEVAQYFAPPRAAPGWRAPAMRQEAATSSQKRHGRLEERRLTAIADPNQYLDWPGLSQVFRLERKVTTLATGAITTETVYGITSLAATPGTAGQLLRWTQRYWGIENGLHWRRDVTLREDATRMTNGNQAQVMATLNNFIIGLANKLGFKNLASAQRTFNARLILAFPTYA